MGFEDASMVYGNSPPSAEQIAEALTSAFAKDRMRSEAPEQLTAYNKARTKEITYSVVLAFPLSLVVVGLFDSMMPSSPTFANMPQPPGFGLISFLVSCSFAFVAFYSLAIKFGESERILSDFKDSMHKEFRQEKNMQRRVGDAISEIAEKRSGYTLIAEAGATVISGNSNSTIFNNSTTGSNYLKNTGDFISGIKDKEPNLADAMAVLAALVEKAGKKEAVEAFENLNSALQAENRKPSMIRAIWNDLLALLPEAATMTGAAAAIAAVIKGQ